MKPQLQKGAGRAEPRGATVLADGVNFSVYSEPASQIFVCLFDERGRETDRIALDGRDGAVHFRSDCRDRRRHALRLEGRWSL